jgi:hypothetical protein
VHSEKKEKGLAGSMLQLSDETPFKPLMEGSGELRELASLADEGSLAYVKRMGIMAWDQFKANPVPKLVSFALGALGVTELRKLFGSGRTLLTGDDGTYKLRKAMMIVAANPVLRKLRTIRDDLALAAASSVAIGDETVKSTSAGIARKVRTYTINQLIIRFDTESEKLVDAIRLWKSDVNHELVMVDVTPLSASQKAIGAADDVSNEIGRATRGAAPSDRASQEYTRPRRGAVSSPLPPPGISPGARPPLPPVPSVQADPDKVRADILRPLKARG